MIMNHDDDTREREKERERNIKEREVGGLVPMICLCI